MNYLSIQSPIIHEIEIKKSRFICYLYPIKDPDEFPPLLQALRKEHYKAAHHCSAYVIGQQFEIQKMSDDGEPSGTAGVPMLEVLKQRELTYLAAVVVRYFGGIKLGAGGLVRAYGQAVSEALNHATIIQNVSQEVIALELSYAQVDSFNYFLSQTDLAITVLNTEYSDKVTFELAIFAEQVATVHEQLVERFNGQLNWLELGEQTVDVVVN